MIRRHRGLAILGAAVLTVLALTHLVVPPSRWVEALYSRGLYPNLDILLRGLSDLAGFSITEVALLLLALAVVWLIVAALRRKVRWRSLVKRGVTALAVLYVWFYLAWGFNYYRQPLVRQLALAHRAAPEQAFVRLGRAFVVRANVLRPDSTVLPLSAIEADIDRVYPQVLHDLGLPPPPPPSRVKRLTLLNGVLSATQTAGFFSPFFHEVHVNAELLMPEIPFVIAHERAHQFGYASEAEASFLAHLVCVRARLPISQYSGYFRVLGRVLSRVSDRDTRRNLWKSLSPEVRGDFAAVRARYLKHAGWISRLSERGYDAYLKSNRVEEGVRSYAQVADLLLRYYFGRDTTAEEERPGPAR